MQPFPRFLSSAAHGWRSVALTTLAAAVALALLAAITLGFGPGTRLAWELVPAYTQVQQTKSFLPLLTFDASFTDAFTMPYCGWPPLYGILLLPFAWLGIPFALATVLLNSLLALLAGHLAARIACAAGRADAMPTVFLAAALSTGIGANLTMAFPHFLIPIPLLLTALVFLKAGTTVDRLPVAGLAVAGAALGVVCGLSNWASYANIAMPFLLVAAVFLPARWRAGFNMRNCLVAGLAMGGAMCICFVMLLAFKEWAYGQPSALPFRVSMDTDKFLARVTGSPVDYAKGMFYTLIRAGAVVLPVIFGLAVSIACGACHLHRPSVRAVLCAVALVLPSLSYALVFVGESNHAAHAFYSILWVGPSLAIFAFADIIRPHRAALIFGATCAAANLLLLLGWKAVPRNMMYVGGIPVSNLTICAPVSKCKETTMSTDSSSALARSVLKQSLYFPYDFMGKQGRVRPVRELGADIRRDSTTADAILIFGDDQIQWDLARFAERTVVGLSSDNASGVARFFEQQAEPLDVMVLVPVGAAAEAGEFFGRVFERTRFQIREVEVFQQALSKH